MSDKNKFDTPPSKIILRGLLNRCPRCGEGRIFERYIKTVENCSVCDEPLARLPADDMPPWMTILLVGFIMIPIMVIVNTQHEMETFAQLVLWLPLALILTLFLLPRCKGVIVALLWSLKS